MLLDQYRGKSMSTYQILRITRLRLKFGLTFHQAAVLAGLAYGEGAE